MHHVLMRHVAVGEYDVVNTLFAAYGFEGGFRQDRNAVRIERAREFRWIPASRDAWDLRGGERDNIMSRIVTVNDIEVMKVAAGRAEDHHTPPISGCFTWHSYILYRIGGGVG